MPSNINRLHSLPQEARQTSIIKTPSRRDGFPLFSTAGSTPLGIKVAPQIPNVKTPSLREAFAYYDDNGNKISVDKFIRLQRAKVKQAQEEAGVYERQSGSNNPADWGLEELLDRKSELPQGEFRHRFANVRLDALVNAERKWGEITAENITVY